MLTSISNNYTLIISTLIAITFVLLGYLFLFKKQDSKLNWSLFYATLYIVVTLPIVNFLGVKFNLWHFTDPKINMMQMPFDLYFLWTVCWGILPFYILKGKHIFSVAILLFWLDILIMPQLQKIGIITLKQNWLIGELALIAFVFLPAYHWAFCSYSAKHIDRRAVFQVVVMSCTFLVGLPFIIESYRLIAPIKIHFTPYIFQLFLIIVFPSLIAVVDLVKKGKGTPFPYDPTKNLVKTGVYAYCRNPIQWSFTLLFIPLSIYYSSFYFLIGSFFSIAYTYGVSNYQEYGDMKKRFGNEWDIYKKSVPKWRFLWKPTAIPKGVIFFDANCNQCNQIRAWFSNANPINLEIKSAHDFPKNNILQVTYIDHNGIEFKSVSAIACALEHLNLAYASLGWFMRFPLINTILQLIIDTMEFGGHKPNCDLK